MQTKSLSLMFRAFSDATRLRVLCLLRQGELCVGDLERILGVSQPMASRHLKYLRKAGLVNVRREGRWMFYSLSRSRGAFHGKLLECLGSCFREVPDVRVDLAKAKSLRCKGGCCPPERSRIRRSRCCVAPAAP